MPVVFADYKPQQDELARRIGWLVLAGVYFSASMVVSVTPVYWLLGAEDRWKWLRDTKRKHALRLGITPRDLAEPSVRGSDWKDAYDGDGDGD